MHSTAQFVGQMTYLCDRYSKYIEKWKFFSKNKINANGFKNLQKTHTHKKKTKKKQKKTKKKLCAIKNNNDR